MTETKTVRTMLWILPVLFAGIAATPTPRQIDIPAWFLADVAAKTEGSGLWIADNSEYVVEDGGIDAYAMHWQQGIGDRTSMTGRLFALREGQEAGTLWEFRVFWHPGEERAYVYQFGAGGALGIGPMEPPEADGTMVLEQVFYAPDGSRRKVRHESRTVGDRETGRSFNWSNGAWVPGRTYVWVLQDP